MIEHRRPIQQLAELAEPKSSNVVPKLGILAIELNDKLKRMMPDLRSSSGVVVVARTPDLRDLQIGLHVGDIIRSINQVQVDSFRTLHDAAAALQDGDPRHCRSNAADTCNMLVSM